MDWENNPELKAIRAEFIDSFLERRDLLRSVVEDLAKGPKDRARPLEEILADLRLVAHKLGGVAGSYQFQTLGRIGELIDAFLAVALEREEPLSEDPHATQSLMFARFLDDALAAAANGKDPEHLAREPRMDELNTVAGSCLKKKRRRWV